VHDVRARVLASAVPATPAEAAGADVDADPAPIPAYLLNRARTHREDWSRYEPVYAREGDAFVRVAYDGTRHPVDPTRVDALRARAAAHEGEVSEAIGKRFLLFGKEKPAFDAAMDLAEVVGPDDPQTERALRAIHDAYIRVAFRLTDPDARAERLRRALWVRPESERARELLAEAGAATPTANAGP